MSHACDVCHHPDRAIIESRIATEPLAAILRDYPHTLFYHKSVCMQGHRWTEFQHPGRSRNSDRWPLRLDNEWLIKVAELYNYDNLKDTRLGITAFQNAPMQYLLSQGRSYLSSHLAGTISML